MGQFTFGKEERLSREKVIQELFDKGSSFYFFPYKVFYMAHPDKDSANTQVLISASKRLFKKAVDRNLIKRRIREANRLNKHKLNTQNKWVIAYIYSVKEILPAAQMKERLVKTFKRFDYVEKH